MLFTESVENQLTPQFALTVDAPAVSTAAACQPLYFTSRGEPIFAWLHATTSAATFEQGVVICPPIGHEQLHAHRGLRHLAEALAARGMAVLRFDWHGTGDSAGSDEDSARCAHWLANVRDAVAWMREKLGPSNVSLIGLRLGALLAAEAMRDEEFETLVLWSPVTSGRAYVREMQLIDGASADAASRKPAGPRAGDLEAGGFVLTAETAERLAAMNLLKIRPRCRRVLIVARDDAPHSAALQEWLVAGGIPVDERKLPGVKQMLAEPHQTEVPRQAIDAILQWLVASRPSSARPLDPFNPAAIVPATMQSSDRPLKCESEKPEATLREFAWQMNLPRRLFGIVTEPVLPIRQTPLVVLLNSGSAYRIGASRLNVLLARRLAARGFRCLRLDLGGLGDSPAATGHAENDSYAPGALGDIAAVLGRAQADFGQERCVLVGLCSGAYFAFQSAVQFDDPTLVESVLINPLTFFWADGMSIDDPEVVESLAEHWRMARRVKFERVWRFLRGRGNVGYWDAARTAARRLASRLVPQRVGGLPPGNSCLPPQPLGHPQTEDLSRDLASVERRGRPLALFLADGDPGLTIMNHHARGTTRRLRRSGLLGVKRIANADHTFSRRAPREKLLDRLAEHLVARYMR